MPPATSRHTDLSDVEVVADVARVLAAPRAAPADSFVLHAPLELAARAALLPHVLPGHRHRARLRLALLADGFEAAGEPVAPPAADRHDTLGGGAAVLVAAIAAGDLDAVDAAARWLGRAAPAADLRRLLGPALLRSLAAAAHAPILLHLLPRTAPGLPTGELLRGAARELARNPDRQLAWVDGPRSPAAPAAVFEALAATPAVPAPARSFIYPVMHEVDAGGLAADLLAGVTGGADVAERGRAVLRAAAWSMLCEPGDHAPYGWSHCLTLPQAALSLADALPDPSLALAVAATHVVGFRAAMATRPLHPVAPPDPGCPLAEALEGPRSVAAAAAWHTPEAERGALVAALATRASVGHDAHLVKYVLACLDAADDDRSHAPLFLAAAASLVAWWAQHPDPDDPLAA